MRLLRLSAIAAATVAAAAIIAIAATMWLPVFRGGPAATANDAAAVGGPFELVDQSGRTVTERSYRGRWLLLFFGYTNCPDVCPLTLAEMADVLDGLGELTDKVRPLFVTVDPERDTPQVLADYLGNVDRRIVGLTGTPQQIAAIAKAYRIYYARVAVKGPLGYAMDHSTVIYVIGPDGRLRQHFTYQFGAGRMIATLRTLMANP